MSVLIAFNGQDARAQRIKLVSDNAGSVNVYIKGVIVQPPPCTINDNSPIDVSFGDNLLTSKVDGSNYLKTINYTLTCPGASSNNIKLSIQGTVADFSDQSALQTNMADLGVELQNNGQIIKVGEWVNFTYPTLPVLQAVPVKRPGSTLGVGEFSAGATMVVDWQ
ncbi:fimbrial protein [Pantoea sp. BAV 3049]|uniref:fimbrial protein n=1 Tax=Pantoea sp. BAV 3049 TaxID=2654188 RepID=UPI001E39D788|nr:fimbrial protein [Pantoea sp. BAV 3049]